VSAPHFEFATAARIVFGAGSVREVAPAAKSMGRRALLVTGVSAELLGKTGLEGATLAVEGEPTLELVRRGVALALAERCDLVIGLGGGSAIDAGKAVAALLSNGGDPLDYLEVVGEGRGLHAPSAPFIAVPTTAGTGAEVTRNAVLASPEHRVKASLRSPWMLPRLAVVDPELTFDLPPAITASTGLDALTQLIEPYVSVRANPMTDMFCLEGMGRAARSLGRAYADGHDAAARTDMSLASLLGGLALANAGLGVVHGFAAPIGGAFEAPHGAVCAALLPHGMDANIRALPGSRARKRAARPLPDRGPHSDRQLGRRRRRRCGLGDPNLPGAARSTPAHLRHPEGAPGGAGRKTPAKASSMKGNPIVSRPANCARFYPAPIRCAPPPGRLGPFEYRGSGPGEPPRSEREARAPAASSRTAPGSPWAWWSSAEYHGHGVFEFGVALGAIQDECVHHAPDHVVVNRPASALCSGRPRPR